MTKKIETSDRKVVTPFSVFFAVVFVYLVFLNWQVVNTENKVEAISQEQQIQEMEAMPLNTQAPYKATPTSVVADPNKTPVSINYEQFIYTEFEMRFRGGSPASSCPYRWVSVRNKPSISGEVVACLPPYSDWNVEVRVENKDALVYENGNVWGVLAMQPDKWVALKYGNTYFMNWRE